MSYVRKTADEFRLFVNYGQGWEYETAESTHRDIRARKREYQENCPEYPTKWTGAFALAHPAAFRRIQFGMIERTPGSWQTPGYGYCGGLTAKLAKLFDADNAFLLDGVGEAGPRCNTPEEALAMAQEQLRRAEEKVHAQQAS